MSIINKILIFFSIVLMINSLSGCMLFNATSFSLISSEVIDDDGFPTLLLNFNASDIVTIKLSGPNSQIIFSEMYYRGTSCASIYLNNYRTNPLSGNYSLNVYDKNNNNIFGKKFFFNDIDLSLSKIVEKWWNEKVWEDVFSLAGLKITVTNKGDLPAYIYETDVSIEDKTESSLVLPNVILPKQTDTLCCFVYIQDISTEEHELELSLKSSEGDILASNSYFVTPSENIVNLEYRWRYNEMRYLVLPDFECLYDHYSNLDRLVLDDYAAYIFDVYDDEYLSIAADKLLYLFDALSEVGIVNAVASFIQNMKYVEDDPDDPDCEYPRYPIEMLKDEEGDCEDKAILTATLLDTMGYKVALIRLPNHMAVGVNLDEDASTYDYYIDDYYYLETTRTNWVLGRVPEEYKDLSDIYVHPIDTRSLLLHSWKNATRYSSSNGNDFVKMKIILENLGNEKARNIEIKGAFYSDSGTVYNQEVTTVSFVDAGEKQEVKLEISVPKDVETNLKTQIYCNNEIVDEKESKSTFS